MVVPPQGNHTSLKAVAGSSAAIAYIWYYLSRVCKVPSLYFKEGPLSQIVLEHCPLLQKPFAPTPWAFNGHAQTLLSVGRQFWRDANYRRQALVTPDGGLIALDWYHGSDTLPHLAESAPVLMVFHGLTGGSREGYCKAICAAALQKGWRAAVLNYRGCAGLPLTNSRTYSAAFTDDAHFAVEEIQRRFPDAPLFAAGYSLGSLILTKYLAEADTGKWVGEGSGITCAAMVSGPGCMSTAAENLHRPWTAGYLYNLVLAFRLRDYCKEHEHHINAHSAVEDIKKTATLSQIDEAIICKIFGYSSTEEYYRDGSSQHYIPHITTPALFLCAEDDPFLGRLPVEECSANPNTILAVTARGGHVAFIDGLWPFGKAWMDSVVVDFFSACHHNREKLPHQDRVSPRGRL
ncbi:g638 [Coccomyxa viridis]|uniref:G638 protein n=1 Tax=Coccomyxa viridis TaxID=1274662 RepID=A0ABP1FN06_9CHLO